MNAHKYAAFVLGLFALGGGALFAVAMLLKKRFPGLPRSLGVLYLLELVEVGLVWVPVALGGLALDLGFAALLVLCARELERCMSNARVPLWQQLVWQILYMAIGVLALYDLATRSLPWLAFVYAAVELNDTVAWAVGSAFGKHHPFAGLSPRKTTEGVVGGMVAAGISGWALGFLLPEWGSLERIGLAMVFASLGTIGDLVASYWKRRARVRHYGTLFGERGGLLDMYDSLLMAAPLGCLLSRVMR